MQMRICQTTAHNSTNWMVEKHLNSMEKKCGMNASNRDEKDPHKDCLMIIQRNAFSKCDFFPSSLKSTNYSGKISISACDCEF